MDGKIPHSYLYKEGESMKKIVKLLLIIGLSLTLLGGCLFLVGFGLTGFDIFALQNVQFEEKEYIENTENPITSIALDFDTTDIKVLFDEKAERVVINYPQRKNLKGKDLGNVLVVESENGVKITEQRKITVPVLFNFPSPVATLTLPAGRAYDLSITTDTGDLSFFGNATCSSLLLETDTGDVNTSNSTILCKGKGKIETDTGDVKLGAFDAQELSVTTDTGDVRFTTVISIISCWACSVGLSFVFVLCGLDLYGIWLAFAIDELFRGTLYYVRWRRKSWQKNHLQGGI